MLTAHDIRQKIASGQLSATEVLSNCLKAIEAKNPTLNAVLSTMADEARKKAATIDQKVSRSQPIGRLAGVPILLKDNICTRWGTTSCGSKILQDYRSPYSAYVVERLETEDAVIVGKANMDEFAMGSSNENSAFGPVRNPWNLEYVSGGSSGGSVVGVASGLVPLALGSETGGSVRQPASLCNVVGLKPSYGRVSRYGLVAFGSSLDQIGPIGVDVRDTALLLRVIAGWDRRDSTSVAGEVPDYLSCLDKPLGKIRLGVSPDFFGSGLHPEVRQAVEQAIEVYKRAGAEVVSVGLPHLKYAIACYYIIATAEASSNLARYDGVHYGHRTLSGGDIFNLYSASRAEGFGAEVKRRIMLGTYVLSSGYYDAFYLKALKVRTLIKQDFDRVFEQADVIFSPTSPVPGFKLGERVSDPLAMYLADIYTAAANLAGICAVSIPCGFSQKGLPIGLQLQAPAFAEDRLLQIAQHYQSQTNWHKRQPPAMG